MKVLVVALAVGAIAGAQTSSKSAPEKSAPTHVRIASGEISGLVAPGDSGVLVWKGIPYAAPPIGPLRWHAPAPPVAWRGVRECTKFAPAPVQPNMIRLSVPLDEDCLYLNVWAPADRSGPPKPVMVWISANCCYGSVSHISYDGTALARQGIVLVSVNYRLGPLGFFVHPALARETEEGRSGNFGLLDQLQALKWIRENIGPFGGDPRRVTVFSGASTGGVSACWLLTAPAAKGLVDRAVIQSGGAALPTWAPTFAEAERVGVDAARKLGIAEDATAEQIRTELRAKPATEIVNKLKPATYVEEGTTFVPVIDGTLVSPVMEDLFRTGKFHRVPLIVGTCAGDGVALHAPTLFGVVSLEKSMRKLFGDDAARVLELYPRQGLTPGRDALRDFRTDITFIAPVKRLARSVSANGGTVFLYHFTRVCPELEQYGKAPHAAELHYTFGKLPPRGTEPWDHDLAQLISAAWTRFAATGNPNGGDLPLWPAYSSDSDTHLEFGDEVKTGTALRKKACDLLDSFPGLGPFGRRNR